MARSIQLIKQQMIDTKNTYNELNGLSSVSQTSYWNLWFYIVAVAISLLEQIIDVFKTDIEASIIDKVSGTKQWIRSNVFAFQYSSITPQIINIDPITYKITYPVIDTTLQIVKQCAVSIMSNNVLLIKVAKNTPPEKLNITEANSLSSYLTEIMPAGIYHSVLSVDPDLLRLDAKIYFDGAYSANIELNVKNAINNYLYNMPFGGRVFVSELESAILSVAGVNDVNVSKISTRKSTQIFDTNYNTLIYQLLGAVNDVNNRYYDSYAGYLITETSTSYTINDTLTFIAQ